MHLIKTIVQIKWEIQKTQHDADARNAIAKVQDCSLEVNDFELLLALE